MRGLSMPARLLAWGATPAEQGAQHPADRHVPAGGEHLVRAIDVDAGPAVVHRWLAQLSVAPYSYDLIDNLGRRSPRTLTPGADRLRLGQRVLIGPLVEILPGRGFVTVAGSAGRRLFGDIAMSYEAAPGMSTPGRILVCLAMGPRRRLSLGFWRIALGAGDLLMMRRQLRTLRDLAQRDDHRG